MNLSEVVIRSTDTLDDIRDKVYWATVLGTIQSSYTHFPYLRDIWRENTEEERLLGVSLTGIMDNPLMTMKNKGLEKTLEHLREVARGANAEWADLMGIPRSKAITCVKPSGTVSQLVDSASGIHTRFADNYIRTVRGDNKDPLTQFMKDKGIPNEPCVMKPETTTVFSFPVASPEGSITRDNMTAIEMLETWKIYRNSWCDHNPSITVNVKDDEWMEVGAFVYKNFDDMAGISFLPYDGGTYQQAPYQEVSRDVVEELKAKMPEKIDWSELSAYESEDQTKSSQTFACVSGSCEIVDI